MCRAAVSVVLGLLVVTPALAQPTYKLDVKAALRPWATLTLTGKRITRSALHDDPGFRLQYHFQKDGKTVTTVNARANEAVDLPSVEPGVYTVALELFYPAYKGGNAQKGGFRRVSVIVVYRVEKGDPPRVVPLVPLGSPAASMMFGPLYPLKP